MLGVPKTTVKVDDVLGGLIGLSIVILMTVIYYRKWIQSKLSEGKGAWDKVQRKLGEASRSLLPVESHRICLIPPATNRDNGCKTLSTREAPYRLSVQRFYCRLVT